MSGYLEDYGAGEEKRFHLVRNIVVVAVVVIVVVPFLWYLFRTFPQARETKAFLNQVRDKNFTGAYSAWGCTSAHPCPEYPYDKFLEDWGPASPAAASPNLRILDTESCHNGVIVTVSVAPGNSVALWAEKGSNQLSFAPLPVCPGKGAWAIMAHRTIGRLRTVFF